MVSGKNSTSVSGVFADGKLQTLLHERGAPVVFVPSSDHDEGTCRFQSMALVTWDRADFHHKSHRFVRHIFRTGHAVMERGSPCYAYTDRDTLYEREKM